MLWAGLNCACIACGSQLSAPASSGCQVPVNKLDPGRYHGTIRYREGEFVVKSVGLGQELEALYKQYYDLIWHM